LIGQPIMELQAVVTVVPSSVLRICLRDTMPSFTKTLRKCRSTVCGLNEELRGDLGVRQSVTGQARYPRFLGSERGARLGCFDGPRSVCVICWNGRMWTLTG
jgi:hypothetical protein